MPDLQSQLNEPPYIGLGLVGHIQSPNQTKPF